MSIFLRRIFSILFLIIQISESRNCDCDSGITFIDGRLSFVHPNNGLCMNTAGTKLYLANTFFGKFMDETQLAPYLCDNSEIHKLRIYIEPMFNFFIIKLNDVEQYHIFITHLYYDNIITNMYVYKNLYHLNDFECFHTEYTNILTLADNFKSTFQALMFQNTYDKLRCFWFKSDVAATMELTYNEVQFTITANKMDVSDSPIMRSLANCDEKIISDSNLHISDRITVLSSNDDKFCVKTNLYFLERIKRSLDLASDDNLRDYCYDVNGDDTCFKVGGDFEYALFSTNTTGSKVIVFSKANYDIYEKEDDSLKTQLNVTINEIMCSKKLTYTENLMKVIGIHDIANTKHCMIPSDFLQDYTGEHTIGGQNYEINFFGCITYRPKPIIISRIIMLESKDDHICLQPGYTQIRAVVPDTVKFGTFLLDHSKICYIEYPSSVCYKLTPEIDYVVIKNVYNSMETLIGDFDIYNRAGEEDHIYDSIYYKKEIVCINKEYISDFEKVKSEKYIFSPSEQIKCYMIELMANSDKISIKNYAGCTQRLIEVNPTTERPKPSQDIQNLCSPFIKVRPSDDDKMYVMSSDDIIYKCIELTCTSKIYAFSQTDFQSEKGTYIECAEENSQCIDTTNQKYLVYRVKNQLKRREIYVSSRALTIHIDDNILYSDIYYKNEIVCLKTADITSGNTAKNFQLNNDIYSCSVINHLEDNEVIITITTTDSCANEIKLYKHVVNPHADGSTLHRTCASLVTDTTTKPIKVNKNILQKCITRTCTKIHYYFDLSPKTEQVTYKSQACDINNVENQTECIKEVSKDALMKLTSPRSAGEKILFTKDLTTNIPQDYYYQSYYGPEDLVCFQKSDVDQIDTLRTSTAHIESSNRICFLPKSVTDVVTLKLIVHSSCKRDILMSSADQTNAKAIDTKCNDYHSTEGVSSKILSEQIDDIKDCITKLCLTLEYQIMNDGGLKNCNSGDTCDLNDTETKYFKITSRYNEKSFYVIPHEVPKTEILISDKSGYYKSQFYERDFVCYKSTYLRDEDKGENQGVIGITTGKHCFTIKDLTSSKTIGLNVWSRCTRMISFVNSISTASNKIDAEANDEICKSFREQGASEQVLKMNLETLKKCVTHFCLKPAFIAKKSFKLGDFARVYEQCDATSASCVTDASFFDYVKLSNPYTQEEFYVQNSEMQSFSVETNFFYPSPFYKNEVLCIENTRITDTLLSLTKANSYSIETITCIIINEVPHIKTKVEIDKNKCSREISFTNTLHDKSTPRLIDRLKCQNFLNLSPSQKIVHSTTKADMESCLQNTCLKVSGFVNLENNKPLTQSILATCEDKQTFSQCIESDTHYDFIKVGKNGDKDFQLFRLFPSSQIDAYTPSQIEYYHSEYYKNDVVCFNSTKITGQTEWTSQSGIFLEKSRVCIIADLLTDDLDIEYKITDTYNEQIKIKTSTPTDELENVQSIKNQCREFFNANPTHNDKYYSSLLETMKNCIAKTRSFVEFLVPLTTTTTNGDYAHQKLRVCKHHTNIDTCLTEVTHFDAMKVKSPYRNDPFYIRSEGLTKTDKKTYVNFLYKNTYYSDDIICTHDDYLTEPEISHRNLPGFISFSNVNCVIIKDTTEINHIRVKQFNKCSKIIHFSRYTSDSNINSDDICAPFYAQKAPKSVVTLSIATLKSCIASTCGRLEYFTENQENNDLFVKKMNDCHGKKDDGDISCLENVKSYFIAKVRQGNSENYFYVQQDAENGFNVKDYDSYFYSSMYYKDQMVCFNKEQLPDSLTEFSVIDKGNKNLRCLYPTDTAKTTTLSIKTQNNCNQEISFIMTESSSTASKPASDECNIFYSVSNSETKIKEMSHENIKNCILKSCSKVLSVINRNTQQTAYTSEKITFCSSSHGDHSCITGTQYDFGFISNSYLTETIIVRSKNYDDLQASVSKTTFDKSVYFKDDIICQDSSLILDLQSISSQEGVYSNERRTCVIGSKIIQPISFMLNVTEHCNRTIHVVNSELHNSIHTSNNLDAECRAFYDNSQTLLVQSHETVLKCVAHTCSTVKFINQLISAEKCKDGDKECDKSEQFTYGVVTSPYSSHETLVISENVKNHWISIFDAPENYDSDYSSEQYVCFQNDIFRSTLSTSKKYVNKNLNIACMKLDVSDKELLLIIETGETPAVKLMKYDDPDIRSAASKKVKFILHSLRTETGSMVEVFSHEEIIESSSNDKKITDFHVPESCFKGKEESKLKDDFKEDDVPDLYAMSIASNIIFQSPIGFFLKNHTACAQSFTPETHLSSVITVSDTEIPLHHMECIMIWKDMLTVKLNSEAIKESLNTERHCVDNVQLKKKCDVTYEYNQHILICYISKSKAEDLDNLDDADDPEKSYELSTVYVMIKKYNCYVPKIMKYQRIAMCHLAETGLTIKIIDFDIKGEKKAEEAERQKSTEIYSSLWKIFAVGGCSVGMLFFLLSRKKRKRSLEAKYLQ